MKRLNRTKIVLDRSADIYPLQFQNKWQFTCDKGNKMDLSFIEKIDRGEMIFQQLVNFANRNKKSREIVYRLSRYLKYVASVNGAVSGRSLNDYKKLLEQESNSGANTKYQVFSVCKSFVLSLERSEVIPASKLPRSFNRTKKKPKSTIIEIGYKFVDNHKFTNQGAIAALMEQHNIDETTAKSYLYASEVLRCLHEGSIKRLELYVKDCTLIDSYVDKLDSKTLAALSGVKDFRAEFFDASVFGYEKRTLELAFKILFAKYGYLIPSSPSWPPGMADFFKYHDWPNPRVKAAFFSDRYYLQFLLVASLSHRQLAPNVDSVFYYAYLDTCTPSSIKGRLSFHFGKKRGSPSNNEVRSDDRLGQFYVFVQKRLKNILQKEKMGYQWVKREDCPIFLHFHQHQGGSAITSYDASLSVDFVRKVASILSHEYPILSDINTTLTGESFRPTIAVLDAITDTQLSKIQKKLGHKNFSTTKDYVFKNETQSLILSKQETLQKYLISQAKQLEYTGSGYKCGKTNTDAEEVICKGVSNCFKCTARRVVLKDINLIAEWLAYENEILKEQSRLMFNNPARWNDYWMVKLTEYQVLLSKCTHAEKRDARKISHKVCIPHLD